MLKQLLQLLLETFLKAKKEWIQAINTPHWHGDVKIDVQSLPDYEPNNYFKRYVPPANGFVVYASTGESEQFCLQTQGFFSMYVSGYNSLVIRVYKGETVFLQAKDTKELCRFVPLRENE